MYVELKVRLNMPSTCRHACTICVILLDEDGTQVRRRESQSIDMELLPINLLGRVKFYAVRLSRIGTCQDVCSLP